jgi:branched-chain amino acid transport system permease protein
MGWKILGQQIWYGLVTGGAYVVFASGLTLAFGVMRIINMAHGELCMLGAMLVYTLMAFLGMNLFLAACVSIAAVGLFGIILNRVAIQPVLGISPLNVLLSTLGVSLIMMHGGVAIWGAVPRQIKTPFTGVKDVFGVRISEESLALFVVGAIALTALHLVLTRAKIGKQVRAISQNMLGASLVGINTKRVQDYTMGFSAILGALAGILMTPIWSASPNMGQPMLVTGFVVVIVAGLGSIWGAVLVGLLLGVIEALFGQYVSTFYRAAFTYALMIIVLLLKPEGLFGRR